MVDLHVSCVRLTLFRNKNKCRINVGIMSRFSYSGIYRMYSKHSALGSRITGINGNNDVIIMLETNMASSWLKC